LAHKTPILPAAAPSISPPADADLAQLIDRWPSLSATARRMILAAVDADSRHE
jgi:hypothetical protein